MPDSYFETMIDDIITQPTKKELRNTLKKKRRAQPQSTQRSASQAIVHKLWSQTWVRNAKTIAGYWPLHGEVSLIALLHRLRRNSLTTLLPRVAPKSTDLQFFVWKRGDDLLQNQMGIPEPRSGCPVPIANIDVVCLPLVAFDRDLNRLGMGGGYYDRAFALTNDSTEKKPLLCGIAHEFQYVDKLDADPWDVPLDYVVTPNRVLSKYPPAKPGALNL